MNAARKMKATKAEGQRDLVMGLGATGLSIARYLQRQGRDACFIDSREEPPGLAELESLWPDADVVLGADKLPKNIERVIVSPGIADSDPLLQAARDAGLEIALSRIPDIGHGTVVSILPHSSQS